MEVTREQVATHNTADDCWAVLQGLVFDLTAYLPYHPGGADVLLEHAGGDVTAPFRTPIGARARAHPLGEYHSWVNWERLLDGCIVGRVVN